MKDVTYHSSNQTVKVVKAQLQWRYWIRRPTSEQEIRPILGGEDGMQSAHCVVLCFDGDADKSTQVMGCRIQVSLQGFEWFLYNRTAAYDHIISQMDAGSRPLSRSTERKQASRTTRAGKIGYTLSISILKSAASSSFHLSSFASHPFPLPLTIRKAVTWVKRQLPNLDPKDLLPLGIEVDKGAIICGNSSTPNLLVAEFQRTEGTFGIVEVRNPFTFRCTLS